MYDDAISAFQFYYNQVRESDQASQDYMPCAINFVKEIGDIITAVNSHPRSNYEDFKNLREASNKDLEYKATVLRKTEMADLI